ncbi:hypothetical protein [Paraflavitalea pollutisoli]|uniref:hypothetical protein n=1 Tax=Paraflavitalea pollutisoli TaxID=3034143 RepID=UPI0023EA9A0E|nr:hypothetical protein [Paraflavitalea sp. H1-2-19X]
MAGIVDPDEGTVKAWEFPLLYNGNYSNETNLSGCITSAKETASLSMIATGSSVTQEYF